MPRLQSADTPPTPGFLARLASCVLLGASLGAAEMTVRVLWKLEPSVARRAPGLLLYAVVLYATVALSIFLLCHLLIRAGSRLPFPASPSGPAARFAGCVAGTLVLGLIPVLGWSQLWRKPPLVLLGTLVLSLPAALLAGWVVTRLFAWRGGPIERLLPALWKPARVVAACTAVLLLSGGATLLLSQGSAGDGGGTGTAFAASGSGRVRPNIILIVVDTLRADVLGPYGGPPGLSPAVDALASGGVLFERATSASSWTLPSVASILTSLHPHEHGFVDFDSVLPAEIANLPGELARAGYDCRAWVGNPLLSVQRGFSRGFEFYDVYDYRLEGELLLSRAIAAAIRLSGSMGYVERGKDSVLWPDASGFPWLTTKLSFYVLDGDLNERVFSRPLPADGRPLFLYVHYVAPHSPYLTHPLRRIKSQPKLDEGNLPMIRSLYEGEVGYTDEALADLLARLGREGILDGAIVVLTSDHGEEFLEHGRWEHGKNLYQEVLHVPLIVAGPGLPAGARIGRRVELLDLAPTLLDLAGTAIPGSFSGRSLRGLMQGAGDGYPPRPIFSELTSRYLNPADDYRSVTGDVWKIIRRRKPDGELKTEEIFDLDADPREASPVGTPPPVVEPLIGDLDEYETREVRKSGEELSEEELQKMRALGYVR